MLEFDLVAKSPFGGFDTGQRITDPALIAEIMGDERQTLVVKVAALPRQAPAAVAPVEPVAETPAETAPAEAAPEGAPKAARTRKAADA